MSTLFCDGETVISQITRWRVGNVLPKSQAGLLLRGLSAEDAVNRFGAAVDAVEKHGEPDQLFVTHLLMVALEKEGKLTAELLNEALLLGLPPLREVPILRWNSRHTFGISHGVIPIPQDPDDAIGYVTLTQAWDYPAFDDRDVQNEVINLLKSALSADVTESTEPTPVNP